MFKIYKEGEFKDFAIFAQASGMPVGFIFQALYDELDPTQHRLDGVLLNRNRYTALWAYVQKHPSLIKTEQEWQEIAAQDDGCCRFFSSGDGSTTFRLPKYPNSEILIDKTDYVIQTFGYITKEGALSSEQFQNMIDTSIDEVEENINNNIASNYLKLTGGTLTGDLTIPKLITETGLEIY